MKLRLDNKSVRIRLTKEEILDLESNGYIEDRVFLTEDNQFSYVIEIVEDLENCKIAFDENGLVVEIPNAISSKWINSNQVGIKESFDTDEDETITLFVEEDLPPRKNK